MDDDGVLKGEPVPIHVKVTIAKGDMTIDLSGCSAERSAGINSRTLAGARVAYKALTGPLEPVNEGSFRALKVIIPEGNIMMARFPAPMAGWSIIVPTVVDTIVKALAPAMRDRVPAGHHGLLGGAVVFFGVHPKTKRRFVVQSIEGGGWGGRPYRGRRVRDRLGLPGRRAQRLDRGHRAQMPGAGRRPRAAARFLRRRQVSRRARHRHARAQPGRGPLEFRAGAPRATARPGACGAASRAKPAAICCGCRARTTSSRWWARTSRCRSTPRRSCAPAAAAAGAIRSSAIRRWCATTCWRSWSRGRPRSSTMASCSGTI